MNARLTISMAALLIGMLAAGCGSGDDSESVSTTLTASSLSKTAFIKRANRICYDGKYEIAKKFQTYSNEHPNLPRNNIGVEAVNTLYIPGVEAQLVDLRELGAPPGESGRIEAFWAGIERANQQIVDEGISVNAEIGGAYMPNPGQQIYDYGLHGCAYGL